MKPLVASSRALSELASGLSQDAIESSRVLQLHDFADAQVLVAADDSVSQQYIVIMRDDFNTDPFVPSHLASHRRETLGRMAAFAERALTSGPLSLPRGWRQYKYNNLIAFAAVPNRDELLSRWTAEVIADENHRVVFWATTTSDKRELLEEFDRNHPGRASNFDALWATAVAASADYFGRATDEQADTEMSLRRLENGATKGWSYDRWLEEIGDGQRRFIDAETDKSVRLRGPAGSGKTLALTLKAVREAMGARARAEDVRILFVTHSWSLATEVAESIAAMGIDQMNEIDTFPLLEIAQAISPQYVADDSDYTLLGSDSLSDKAAQLAEIREVLDEFVSGDWITYRTRVSSELRKRFEAEGENERLALAWDLQLEFGSVIGAAGIFPGAGSLARYEQLSRSSWMMPLQETADLRLIFDLYGRYIARLDSRSLLTSDQVLSDVLNHLLTYSWNRARRTAGYDLIFVDEFHLFSPLERQVIHYLSRDVTKYPRVFMAVDPRQSPSAAFIGAASDETRSETDRSDTDVQGDVTSVELTTVHRFTPEILGLVKHVHHRFPALALGDSWDIDFSTIDSSVESGRKPSLVTSESFTGGTDDIVKAVHEFYNGGRIAIAIVDERQWWRYNELAGRIGASGKFHVSVITSRTDIDGLRYRGRGVVVGSAEHLAGLQFKTVLVAGIPALHETASMNDRMRLLSLLYLAISRAEQNVRLYVNGDDGGAPEVLQQAVEQRLVDAVKGSLV